MSAKIKLNAASGGGSFSLQAPSSSSNNRVITLPDIADGTLLTNQSSGLGKILQVKYGFRTGNLSTTSTSYVDSGITVDITPSATTSKVLILINYLGGIEGASTGGQEQQVRILRDSTEIFTERTADFMRFMVGNAQADWMINGQLLQNLDSPSTTSAITYKLQLKRSGTGTQYAFAGSNICVMEVAA